MTSSDTSSASQGASDFPLPRRALVTGAARRLGREIALTLARAGWDVAIHFHKAAAEAAGLAEEIAGLGRLAAVLQADLSDPAQCARLVPDAGHELGPLGCLVNNASLFAWDTPADLDREMWNAHLETNLSAPVFLTQAFARQLGPEAGGAVINMLDQRVWNLTPYFTSYTASKAALWAMTQSLALALAPRIRVNGIGPGPTLPSARQSTDDFERQWRKVPLERPTDPAEIGRAVRFILETPSMTGQMIALDGGQHLGWRQPIGPTPEE